MDITEVTLIDIAESFENNVCRLCGYKSSSPMEDIFDVNKDILEKICSCLPIVILPHDPYPHQICSSCHNALDVTAKFIRISIATDKNFREGKDVINSAIESIPLERPLHCDICSLNFAEASLFDKHVEEHKNKIEFSVHLTNTSRTTCSNCGMSFNEINDYLQHKTLQVNRCPCGQVFPSKCKLTKHRCTERILKAKLSMGFVKSEISENDSKIHINKNIVNTVISNARKTQEEKRLKSEMLIQRKKTRKRFIICTFCHENFSTNKELKAHCIQVHNSTVTDEWICRFCNKSMTTKVGLIIHERIHDGTKPYICEWCGKGFRSRANLTQHQVVHTGIRKYPCPRCNKRFSRRSFVETHMRVHTGERPYCCDICGYRFTQIGDMKRHRNKHQTYPGFSAAKVLKSEPAASE